MACHSLQPRDRIFAKGYGFLSFAKNMSKNIDKNISKNLSGETSSKCSQKPLDHAKQFAIDPFKTTSKRAIQATGYLIGNKNADSETGKS